MITIVENIEKFHPLSKIVKRYEYLLISQNLKKNEI
jgi:hypothetical protein